MIGDRIFNAGVELAAREMAQANSEAVFLYEFGFRGSSSLSAALAKGDTTDWGERRSQSKARSGYARSRRRRPKLWACFDLQRR